MTACSCTTHAHFSMQQSAHAPLLPAPAFLRGRLLQAPSGQRARRSAGLQSAAASAAFTAAAAVHYAPLAAASFGGAGSLTSLSSLASALGFSIAALLFFRNNQASRCHSCRK